MASLSPLADLVDVEDRLGRDLEAAESRKADALLRDASSVVRSYARRDFILSATVERYRPQGHKVVLPLRPVVSVNAMSTVVSFGPTEMITPMTLWNWPGGGSEVYFSRSNLVINGPSWWENEELDYFVQVSYTHGYTSVPDEIKMVVANIVLRNLAVPGGGLVDSETVGPYTVRYSTFTGAGPLGLSEGDRQVLNRYRSTVNRTMELRG